MTDQPDRPDGDGLRAICKDCGAPISEHMIGGPAPYHPRPVFAPPKPAPDADPLDVLNSLRQWQYDPTVNWRTRKLTGDAADVIDQLRTRSPAPDAMREALFKREPRAGGYAFVTAPAFPGWSFMLTPVCPEVRELEMRLSLVAFLEAEALSTPVPPADA